MKKVISVVLGQLRIDENRFELQYQRQIKSQILDLAVTVRLRLTGLLVVNLPTSTAYYNFM